MSEGNVAIWAFSTQNGVKQFYSDFTVVKCFFSKLKSGGKIPRHVDLGDSLTLVNRIHIPIFTNDNVLFSVNDIDFNFSEGQIIEINNTLPHFVHNNSIYDRIHIVMDLMDNKYLTGDTQIVDIVNEKMEGFEL